MFACSSVEVEYWPMAYSMRDMWCCTLLDELGYIWEEAMTIHYDNQVAIYIVSNLVFHERIKHIEVDWDIFMNVVNLWCEISLTLHFIWK